jgi:enoyl-CoA hydratase/carnithine racemase
VIRAERRNHLLILQFERPEKRNALTRQLVEQLTHELRRAAVDDAIRGVILAGAGPSFCAGVDLHEFAAGTPESVRQLIRGLADLCACVRRLPLPVACAIQGHCLGGALEVAACCDFRVCAPDAQLGMPEVFLGIPSVIDAVMLDRIVGTGRARQLLLTGEAISGETAYNWGLATRLAARCELVDAAVEVLRSVTRHAPEVVAAQKRLHEEWLELAYADAVERSMEPLIEAFRTGRPQQLAAARLRGFEPNC